MTTVSQGMGENRRKTSKSESWALQYLVRRIQQGSQRSALGGSQVKKGVSWRVLQSKARFCFLFQE
jgi:hypothetical protein